MNKRKPRRSKYVLPLEVRIAVIKDYNTITKNARLLSERYGCGRTQIQNIIRSRKELLALYDASKRAARKNGKKIKVENSVPESISDSMAIVLFEWCQRSQVYGLQITEQLLESTAENIAPLLGIRNHRPKEGWVKRILKSYDFSFSSGQMKVSNESFKSLKYTDIMDELGIKYNIPTETEHDNSKISELCPALNVVADSTNCENTKGQTEVKSTHLCLPTGKSMFNTENCYNETARPSYDVSSYREALNVLGPLERFTLLKGNVRAVGLINQLENIFRRELEKVLEAGGID